MDGHCLLDIDCGLERGLQSPHWACQVPRLTVSSILQSPLHHRSTWTLTHSSPLFSSISWWKRMLVTVRISEEGQIWKFLAQPEQNIVQLKEDVYRPPWKIRTRTIISHSFPFQSKYGMTCFFVLFEDIRIFLWEIWSLRCILSINWDMWAGWEISGRWRLGR